MNWVGGIRNRIRMQNDRKQQKEFFERKKFTTTVRRAGRSPPRMAKQHLSMDLMSLRTIHNAHSNKTPDKATQAADRKIRHVDLKEHKSHIKMIDNLDNRISPVKQPSRIQIMDSKESMRLETEERKPKHNSSYEDSYSRQMAPVQETPVNQIFYTHGARPPKGVRTIPLGLVDEIKRRNKKEQEMSDSSSYHDTHAYKRRHEMMHMVTKEDLFPTPVLKKEKRVQITTTATWIPSHEERSFQPYSKPAPSSMVSEMQTLEKQEAHRIARDQHPSFWSAADDRRDWDRFRPKEPMLASTAPNLGVPSEIPGASLQPYHTLPHYDHPGAASTSHHYNTMGDNRDTMVDDYRPRKRSNPFESEDFQITPLRKYMPREPHKEKKNDAKHKRHKRKHQEEGKHTHADDRMNLKGDTEKKKSPYRLTTIDDILDDAKFNRMQPRLNPASKYKLEKSHRHVEETVIENESVKPKLGLGQQQQPQEETVASNPPDDTEKKRCASGNRSKLPKDFRPLHESTPKMVYSDKQNEEQNNSLTDEKFRYRQALTSMLFGSKESERSPQRQAEVTSEASRFKGGDGLKTPDRGIPQLIRERGCFTSPISTQSKQQNTHRFQSEWAQMIKLSKNTKENPANKMTASQREDKTSNLNASSSEVEESKDSLVDIGDKTYDDTLQQGPIDLTLKKEKPVVNKIDVNTKKASISDLSNTDIILDLTVGKPQTCRKQESVLLNIQSMATKLYEVCEETKSDSLKENKKTSDNNTSEEQSVLKVQKDDGEKEDVDNVCNMASETTLVGDLTQKDDNRPKEASPELPSAICNETSVQVGSATETDICKNEKAGDTAHVVRNAETVSVGIQASEPVCVKDSWSQCSGYTAEDTKMIKVGAPMANQFCQTEQDVVDKTIQCFIQVTSSSTGAQTETETKIFKDTASSPIKFNVDQRRYDAVPLRNLHLPTSEKSISGNKTTDGLTVDMSSDQMSQEIHSTITDIPGISSVGPEGEQMQVLQQLDRSVDSHDVPPENTTGNVCEENITEHIDETAKQDQKVESHTSSDSQTVMVIDKTSKPFCEMGAEVDKGDPSKSEKRGETKSLAVIDFSAILHPDSPPLSLSLQISPSLLENNEGREDCAIDEAETMDSHKVNYEPLDMIRPNVTEELVTSSTVEVNTNGNTDEKSADVDTLNVKLLVIHDEEIQFDELDRSEVIAKTQDFHFEQPDSTGVEDNKSRADEKLNEHVENNVSFPDCNQSSKNTEDTVVDEDLKFSQKSQTNVNARECDGNAIVQILESRQMSQQTASPQNGDFLVVPQTDSEDDDKDVVENDVNKVSQESAKTSQVLSQKQNITSINDQLVKHGKDMGETDGEDMSATCHKGCDDDTVEAAIKNTDTNGKPQQMVDESDESAQIQGRTQSPERKLCISSDAELFDNAEEDNTKTEANTPTEDKRQAICDGTNDEETLLPNEKFSKVFEEEFESDKGALETCVPDTEMFTVEVVKSETEDFERMCSSTLRNELEQEGGSSEDQGPRSEAGNTPLETQKDDRSCPSNTERNFEHKKLKSKKFDVPYHKSSQTQNRDKDDITRQMSGTQVRRSRRLQSNDRNEENVAESQSGNQGTSELISPITEADNKENISDNALDSSKGYISDWVSNIGGNEIKFSGKTYERVSKKERCPKKSGDGDSENLEYELVRMLALQEDYEYMTSSHEDSSPGSPVFKLDVNGNRRIGSQNCSVDGDDKVCDGKYDRAVGEDEAKLINRDDVGIDVSEFENELSLLDEKPKVFISDSTIKEVNKGANGDRNKNAENCDVSKESIKSVEEQYDTAEEYE